MKLTFRCAECDGELEGTIYILQCPACEARIKDMAYEKGYEDGYKNRKEEEEGDQK